MRIIWDMETGGFDSCWCADDGCTDGEAYAGWDPSIAKMHEEVALQVAVEIVTRSRQVIPPELLDKEVDDFLRRIYTNQR